MRILRKVGMTESDVVHSGAGAGRNTAGTHAEVEMIGQPDSRKAAGGGPLFPAGTTTQLWHEVTPTPISDPPDGLPHLRHHMAGYALGLNVRDYRGRTLLQHTGGLPGYVSKLAMILVPSSPAVDFSFDFQDLVLRPVSPDSGAPH
jgi:hypothetical protein